MRTIVGAAPTLLVAGHRRRTLRDTDMSQRTRRLAIAIFGGTLAALLATPAQAQPRTDLGPGSACPFCDLRGANLAGRNLTGANLQGADLSKADLSGADLSGAILNRANLTNANLSGAKLNRSAKGPADLTAANITGINLKGASLAGTNLQHVDLSTFDHAGVDLSQAIIVKPASGGAVTCGKANLSGVQNPIYVSPSGTDGPSCGTSLANACAAIGYGITRCYGTAACGVLVMYGEYTPASTIILADGINVYGGCTAGQAGQDTIQSLVTAPPDGQSAMSAAGVGSRGVTVQGFVLQGTKGGAGGASTTLMMNASRLQVIDTALLAGPGGVGIAAPPAGPGSSGAPGVGGAPGTNAQCPADAGGQGAQPLVPGSQGLGNCQPNCLELRGDTPWTGRRAAQGASGGAAPTNCNCLCGAAQAGNPGTPGQDARCGEKGNRSSDVTGRFSGTTWQTGAGGAGVGGDIGGGGGGGGSGGYSAGYCLRWTAQPGGPGGGGGGGGCSGSGGQGGGNGGASFAVSLFGSQLTLTNSSLVGARGGDGSPGGAGASGGNRGAGAPGATYSEGPDGPGPVGGTGGGGGAGGAGGGGAGGNGGPAINVALVANSTVTETAVVTYLGVSGSPGGVGPGGQPVVSGVCTGPEGDGGVAGIVAEKQTY